MKECCFSIVLFVLPGLVMASESLSVLPYPADIRVEEAANYLVGGEERALSIHAAARFSSVADMLATRLQNSGIRVTLDADNRHSPDIALVLDKAVGANSSESYRLSVNKEGIRLTAATPTGIFYAMQTLLQLMPAEIYGQAAVSEPLEIPFLEIEDAPRFEWRGLMVDLSRHFFPKEVLKKVIERMAMHKLNRLHLHLTDDPGWRLEIDRYPELTRTGALGDRSNPDGPAQYLSKNDIRELVDYAAQHHIEIVPEIDMPGHGGAAARSYPEYFDGHITYNIGKQQTYEFVEQVLGEVIELFPSRYIHFGGDELRNHNLESLPEVRKLMKEKGFEHIEELEGYFDRFVADFIAGKGRTPMGWDEVAGYDIGNNAVVQWWRGRHPEARDYAVNKGYRVVISPADHVYLDYPQAIGEPGAPWEGNDNGPNSVELIYQWQIVPRTYSKQQQKQVIGIEAALWTEFIRSEQYLEYMLFPRLAAVAEVAWVPGQGRNYEAFRQRLEKQYRRYRAMGINYRIPPASGDSLAGNAAQYLTH